MVAKLWKFAKDWTVNTKGFVIHFYLIHYFPDKVLFVRYIF